MNNLHKSSDDWASVLAVGAPRILGDVLHAVMGAIVLDQGGLEDALALVRDHVVDCANLQFAGAVDGKAVLALETNVANVLSALPTPCCALSNLALASPPPPAGTDAGPEDLLLQEQQLQKVLNFSDVYPLEVSGELLLGSSPRSLLLRAPCSFHASGPGAVGGSGGFILICYSMLYKSIVHDACA